MCHWCKEEKVKEIRDVSSSNRRKRQRKICICGTVYPGFVRGNNRIYIATMYPFDEESHGRIARHRAMRAEKKFTTIERYNGSGASYDTAGGRCTAGVHVESDGK